MKLARMIFVSLGVYALICAGWDPTLSWYAHKTGGLFFNHGVAYARNLGAPYGGCYLASDLGMTTDDTGDNTALITSFITTTLTNGGYPAAKNSVCLFADGQVKATGKWASAGWSALSGTVRFVSSGSSQANSRATNSTFHGFDLTYTGGSTGLLVVTPNAAGTGYVVGDVVTVVQGGASGGTAQVTSVGGSGNVTGFLLVTAYGTAYATANGLSTTGGTGTGLTVNISIGTATNDCKIQATWAGGAVFQDIDLWSSAGNADVQCFLGATQASPILTNLSFSSGPTNMNGSNGNSNSVGVAINYGMGITFSGYGASRFNVRFFGMCIAARYDGGVGNSPNNIDAYKDYYLGGDKANPSNCDIYDGSSSNPGTNNIFHGGTLEFWSADNLASSVNAAFRLFGVTHWVIQDNGFWDCGARLVIRSNSAPSNVWIDDTNQFGCSDVNIVTTGGFPLGRGNHIPEHLMAGTTGSIGGALTVGLCDTGTVSVPQAPVGYPVTWSPLSAPTTAPGAGYYVKAYIAVAGTVTVDVCAAIATGTPTSSTYNVIVGQPNK